MNELIMASRDVIELVIAGMAGGVLRSIYFRDIWRKYAENLLVGAVVAYYLGPIAPKMFAPLYPTGVEGLQLTELSGFLVGAGGVGIMGWIVDLGAGVRRRNHDREDR